MQALEYRPDEEALAKARRAKKFNVQFDATEGAMMDMGEPAGALGGLHRPLAAPGFGGGGSDEQA